MNNFKSFNFLFGFKVKVLEFLTVFKNLGFSAKARILLERLSSLQLWTMITYHFLRMSSKNSLMF